MNSRRLLLFIFYAFWVVKGFWPLPVHCTQTGVHAEENALQHNGEDSLIRVAIGNDMAGIHDSETDLKNIQAAWDIWYEEIVKKAGLSMENFFYYDIYSMVNDFNGGKLDMINTTSLNYFRMLPEIEKNLDSEIYGVVSGGTKTHRYLLLVRSDAGFSHIRDLQNAKLILKKEDDTGRFYMNTILLRNDQAEVDQFFLTIQETSTFSQAILSLFFKKGDVCMAKEAVFNTMVELNPQVGRQLRILHTSPEIVNGVFFFHKNFDQKVKEIIVNEVLHLEETSYGQQVLMLFKVDRLIQFNASDLEPMKVLLQEYEDLKRKQRSRALP